MKTILLIRHAKSDWNSASGSDFERPLNNRGSKDAPKMAEVVKNHNIIPDLIISSPAKRAKTTAIHFAEVLDHNTENIQFNEKIYHGDHKELIKIIKSIDNSKNTAFLFGHNPDITTAVSLLSGNLVDNMPTCGVACIDFDCNSWEEINNHNGKMRFFEYPKLY